jgi:hypothetical protein
MNDVLIFILGIVSGIVLLIGTSAIINQILVKQAEGSEEDE